MTQQVSSSATSWVVDAARTRTVDLDYYRNSQLKTITRRQGSNTTGLVTEFKQNSPDDWWVPGRVSAVEHSGLGSGNQTTAYDFDLAGRVTQKVTPAQTYNYGYDATDQLTQVTNAGGQTLQDPNFNAIGQETAHTTGYYNRVLNDGTYTYEYDNEGNRTKRTRLSDGTYDLYTWDHRQRLTSVTTYNAIQIKVLEVRYEYDALDRRIRRKVDANSDNVFEIQQRFLYDTNVTDASFDDVVQIVDEVTGHRQRRFLNGPAPDMVLADEVFSSTGTPGDILWLLQDQQQTVTDVATMSSTSGPATLQNHLEYNAFGQITSQTNSAYQPQQTYTGQMLDSVTGLLYYDARWFDPHTNQFLSEDPIGFRAGDANLRRYVGNSNPNATDPSGLMGIPLPDPLQGGVLAQFVDKGVPLPESILRQQAVQDYLEQFAKQISDRIVSNRQQLQSLKGLKDGRSVKMVASLERNIARQTARLQRLGPLLARLGRAAPIVGNGLTLLCFNEIRKEEGTGQAILYLIPIIGTIEYVRSERSAFDEELSITMQNVQNQINADIDLSQLIALEHTISIAQYELTHRPNVNASSAEFKEALESLYISLQRQYQDAVDVRVVNTSTTIPLVTLAGIGPVAGYKIWRKTVKVDLTRVEHVNINSSVLKFQERIKNACTE